jgi:hypothetical protein
VIIEEQEKWKAGASRYAECYRDVRHLLSDEFSSNVRWLGASLFALNAGGLASLSAKGLLNYTQECAGFIFWLGIALAFAHVAYAQLRTNQFLQVIQKIENYWVNVAVTGEPEDKKIAALETQKGKIETTFAPILALGSFVMFSLALLVLSKQ